MPKYLNYMLQNCRYTQKKTIIGIVPIFYYSCFIMIEYIITRFSSKNDWYALKFKFSEFVQWSVEHSFGFTDVGNWIVKIFNLN